MAADTTSLMTVAYACLFLVPCPQDRAGPSEGQNRMAEQGGMTRMTDRPDTPPVAADGAACQDPKSNPRLKESDWPAAVLLHTGRCYTRPSTTLEVRVHMPLNYCCYLLVSQWALHRSASEFSSLQGRMPDSGAERSIF